MEKGSLSEPFNNYIGRLTSVQLGNEPVLKDNEIIGKKTSISFGYRIGRPLALAYIDQVRLNKQDQVTIQVDIAGDFFCETSAKSCH